MSDIPSTWPEYQNFVELQPKVQEERRLDSFPKLSFPVGTLVIETWGRVDYVLTAWGLQQEKNDLKKEVEWNFFVDNKKKIYDKFKIENIQKLLSDPIERGILVNNINHVSWWILNSDNSINLSWKTLPFWSPENTAILTEALEYDKKMLMILLNELERRKKNTQ